MDIQNDIKAVMHLPVVGCNGTELGGCFNGIISEFGLLNIHFICSLVYNLGKMHGIREERARRKEKHD